MPLSRDSRIVCALLLIAVPSIMYGGITLLGLLTGGAAGLAPGNLELDATQHALWRAGHAHAGVFVILSLILQPLVDQTAYSRPVKWLARLGAPAAAILLPAGLFGLAFMPGFQWLVYLGGGLLAMSMLLAGIGLLLSLRSGAPAR